MAELNREWLEGVMAQRAITYDALQKEFHFHRDTIKGWEEGKLARPYSVRKLAAILGISVSTLIRHLGVQVMNLKTTAKK